MVLDVDTIPMLPKAHFVMNVEHAKKARKLLVGTGMSITTEEY